MTYDGYWEIYEKKLEQLDNNFWMIRDQSGNDVTTPKRHFSEESAWKEVIRSPFDKSDYLRKGYHAVRIDVQQFERELAKMKNRGYI